MPSPFDITVATNTVVLDNKREGAAAFTVKNNTRRRIHALLRVTVQPPDGLKWLTIVPAEDGAAVRDFPIDGTQNVQVKIAAPPDAAPGTYTLRLIAADEVNPDDSFSESPDVLFTVREIPKPAPRPIPGWLIAAVIAAVALIVVIIAGGVILSNRQQATPTPTIPPSATVVTGPCLITLIGAQFVYQQPDTISNSMFDQVQAGAQLTPVGKSADDAWWKLSYYNTWLETSLLKNTATITGNCTTLPSVCLLAITGDTDIYSKPTLSNTYGQAHAGYQFVPTGKLADNSWWQVSNQESWIPTSVFGQKATTSGDCNSLPVVSAPA